MEYLCERGADVNRGQRSSSLHYAACFGRPAVAKVIYMYMNCLHIDTDGPNPLTHSATGSISPRRTKTTFFHKLKMKLCHYIHREIFFFYSGMGKGRIKIVVRDSNIMTK